MTDRVASEADENVRRCLDEDRSFALIAGAGSGKTSSLVEALTHLRNVKGSAFRRHGQRIACITYTKRAVEVIKKRLDYDSLFLVSTLHSFLWNEIGRFTHDIRAALVERRIPALIARAKEKDNGGKSKEVQQLRVKIVELEAALEQLPDLTSFSYEDSRFSDYGKGRLSHDDIVEIASFFFTERKVFRRLIGFRFPIIFVDEAQDTFDGIIEGFNLMCHNPGLPMVGYFGDPWQQIYKEGETAFAPPDTGETIKKKENFRCSQSVIKFLNAFRDDVTQYAAGKNSSRQGSVCFTLIESEIPELPRNRYSDAQVIRNLARFDLALEDFGLGDATDVVKLFLVRQMIARRFGFPELHRLFTGKFASSWAQDAYEEGSHPLLKPILDVIWPLQTARVAGDERRAIDILRQASPSFATDGPNSNKPLREMIEQSRRILALLERAWNTGSMRDVFLLCHSEKLINIPERLIGHLSRSPRSEEYKEELYGAEKEDWLVDAYFAMPAAEIISYCGFLENNSAYSTQHGVKGEEYKNVIVVYDDIEAAWSNYSFTKLLTPKTAGAPTEGQLQRGKKLAYVCFSRATENLRVVLFTPNPKDAEAELIARGLVVREQVRIMSL